MHIIFICTGNTCRSPMAESYFRQICTDPTVTVSSAGVATADGYAVSAEAAAALQQAAVKLASRFSTALTAEQVDSADRIITMTHAHRDLVVRRYPQAAAKTQTLLSLVGDSGDISDPIGAPLAVYRHCLQSMQPALQKLCQQICAS